MDQAGDGYREGTYWLGVGLAGLAMGIGSTLPILNLGNCLGCLWAWGPAVALIYVMAREGYRVTPMTGLVAGLATTIVGCLVLLPISAVMMLVLANPVEQMLELDRQHPGLFNAEFKSFLSRSDAPLLIWLSQGLCSGLAFGFTAGLAGMIAGHFWRNDPPSAPLAPMPAVPTGPPGAPGA